MLAFNLKLSRRQEAELENRLVANRGERGTSY